MTGKTARFGKEWKDAHFPTRPQGARSLVETAPKTKKAAKVQQQQASPVTAAGFSALTREVSELRTDLAVLKETFLMCDEDAKGRDLDILKILRQIKQAGKGGECPCLLSGCRARLAPEE